MATSGGIWAPIAQRLLRQAAVSTTKVTNLIRTKLADASRTVNAEVAARSGAPGPRQPIHHLAFLRQQKRGTKVYTTGAPGGVNLNYTLRRPLSSSARDTGRLDRTAFLKSNIASNATWKNTGRSPFASTLRPNLTGGALPRTAGGYSMPGRSGVRYFSHTPAAPAQVVQNVSQAMRAFWLSGQRARFDGKGPNGEARYRAISVLQDETAHKMSGLAKNIPGSFVDFKLNPTITALSPLAAAFPFAGAHGVKAETTTTLCEEGFLDVLSVDFARALKDMTAVMKDLKALASLGDLQISLENSSMLRVRFPGVDADTVERLCEDLGIMRGIVGEDADFDAAVGAPVALRFPFAPDADNRTITSPGGSMRSHQSGLSSISEDDIYVQTFMEENPWLSSTPTEEGYESMSPPIPSSGEHCSEDFDGLEGIYRFLEECDRAKARL